MAQATVADTRVEMTSVSVVLPVYNERGNLKPLAEELLAVLDGDSEVLFVDDGSTDGSREVLVELSECNRVGACLLSRNFGQSAALAAGIEVAAGDVIVTMDADGQNDPADIPRLLETLADGYDCVSGWRRDRQGPLTKRVPSEIQTYLAQLTGPDIHDFGCTLTAYRAEALRAIELYGEGHRYIPAKLYRQGYSVTEIEVTHRPREHGQSKYGAGRLVRGFVDLVFHLFWNRYGSRPLHLLGGGGLLALGAGVAIGGHALAMKFLAGAPLAPHLPRLILVALLVTFGLQLLAFGAVMESLTKLHYRNEQGYRVSEFVGFE